MSSSESDSNFEFTSLDLDVFDVIFNLIKVKLTSIQLALDRGYKISKSEAKLLLIRYKIELGLNTDSKNVFEILDSSKNITTKKLFRNERKELQNILYNKFTNLYNLDSNFQKLINKKNRIKSGTTWSPNTLKIWSDISQDFGKIYDHSDEYSEKKLFIIFSIFPEFPDISNAHLTRKEIQENPLFKGITMFIKENLDNKNEIITIPNKYDILVISNKTLQIKEKLLVENSKKIRILNTLNAFFPVIHHPSVPKYKIMTNSEIQEELKNVDFEHLRVLSYYDPVSIYMNFDVISNIIRCVTFQRSFSTSTPVEIEYCRVVKVELDGKVHKKEKKTKKKKKKQEDIEEQDSISKSDEDS